MDLLKYSIFALAILIFAGCGDNSNEKSAVLGTIFAQYSGATSITIPPSPSYKYVATNQEISVYHYPYDGISRINDPTHRIWFVSAASARATGRTPCQICNPPTSD